MYFEKDRRKSKIINFKYNIIFLLKYSIILFYFIPGYHIYNSRNENRALFLNNNEIRLKIAGPGNYSLINPNFINRISSIYLDNNAIEISSSIDLPNSINNIKLSFSNSLTSCGNMFKSCSKIIEIDLSDFISTNVTNIDNMFDGCSSLKSINFGNFQTIKLKNMLFVFRNCVSLETLDLSSFDTSNVQHFHYMFHGCKSLKYLDLSNFKTTSCVCTNNMFN